MKSPITRVIIFTLVLVCLFGSSFLLVHAQTGPTQIVPDCGNNCGASDFFNLLNNIITYFTFTLAVPVATIAIVYAGIIMVSNPGKEGKRTEGKEIIEAAVIGLVLVLAAWLIVTTIINSLDLKEPFRSNINRVVPSNR